MKQIIFLFVFSFFSFSFSFSFDVKNVEANNQVSWGSTAWIIKVAKKIQKQKSVLQSQVSACRSKGLKNKAFLKKNSPECFNMKNTPDYCPKIKKAIKVILTAKKGKCQKRIVKEKKKLYSLINVLGMHVSALRRSYMSTSQKRIKADPYPGD